MVKRQMISIADPGIARLAEAAQDRRPVSGLTHEYYRYPARFSPWFARAAIEAFTRPGDFVYDPFMGGGTTLVEASALGRKAVGTDINRLAVFVTRVKTTPLTNAQLELALVWFDGLADALNLRKPPQRAADWINLGYQKNISGKTTWPIRKLMELALSKVQEVADEQVQNFIRCALLRTGQWALDCKETIPRAEQFRRQFFQTLQQMVEVAREYYNKIKNAADFTEHNEPPISRCLHCSAMDIHRYSIFSDSEKPSLILTSPPYPGVHALYHRWQVKGRRETPAPFWIANCLDGNGASFYTLGDRKQQDLRTYFEQIRLIFRSLAKVSCSHTIIAQLVAFSSPSWQLPEYLSALKEAGFVEIFVKGYRDSLDGRIWRTVPNRKFYADNKGATAASKEVVLLHRPS
ncbi:MAG TPA: hypothetical protein ENN18_11685 [Proteobacteria bacterium]|nr:hypothetical protein [Pseudomonadota bacterium]